MKNPRRGCLVLLALFGFIWIALRLLGDAQWPTPGSISGRPQWAFELAGWRRPHGSTNTTSAAAQEHGDTLPSTHHELVSHSTPTGRYFDIDFLDMHVMNPNILPHPLIAYHFLVVGQLDGALTTPPHMVFAEVSCTAAFAPDNATLRCVELPTVLPIANTTIADPEKNCPGNLMLLTLGSGPHDARVFHGPAGPLVVYGSNSGLVCFGQWAQDLRSLVPDVPWDDAAVDKSGILVASALAQPFVQAAELHRPPPLGALEKNFFLFWDLDGALHAHYDVYPHRAFAAVDPVTGMAGPDLGASSPQQRALDAACLGHYLPAIPAKVEGSWDSEAVHQATNTLLVTLCRRADVGCRATEANTVVVTVVQHKKHYEMHAHYEPYAVAFAPRAPFGLVGVSSKPLLVRGRGTSGVAGTDGKVHGVANEMFYIVSMSWRGSRQRWHGYLDDELFLAFGIEDKASGGIDVRAEDLLYGLGLCNATTA